MRIGEDIDQPTKAPIETAEVFSTVQDVDPEARDVVTDFGDGTEVMIAQSQDLWQYSQPFKQGMKIPAFNMVIEVQNGQKEHEVGGFVSVAADYHKIRVPRNTPVIIPIAHFRILTLAMDEVYKQTTETTMRKFVTRKHHIMVHEWPTVFKSNSTEMDSFTKEDLKDLQILHRNPHEYQMSRSRLN